MRWCLSLFRCRVRCLAAALTLFAAVAAAQQEYDTLTVTSAGDTARFWVQIPALYSPANPPAILVYWHQLGGNHLELRNSSDFEVAANTRGWICASHHGPNDRHWNTPRAQDHCRAMLDWILQRFPFHPDSIYMIGGSMGGAAGQVWHNNNCGLDDYFIAAHAGGSQILDCQLRQEQYLSAGDTNRSMRAAFGGLPMESDSIAWAYHRSSAIHVADTTESMHFNSLHLPVWNTWGATVLEDTAYGRVARAWDSLRRADNADTTVTVQSTIAGHGIGLMPADSVCNWLSGFSANRYPDRLSINADEDDSYYWTTVVLAGHGASFGRYGVFKDSSERLIEIAYVRNVGQIGVDFRFPWCAFDSLVCVVHVIEPEPETVGLALVGVPEPTQIVTRIGAPVSAGYHLGVLNLTFRADAEIVIHFDTPVAPPQEEMVPRSARILRAFPNPFNATVVLDIESHTAVERELVLYDLLGRAALTRNVSLRTGTQRIMLDASALTSGTYYVRLAGDARPQRIVLVR